MSGKTEVPEEALVAAANELHDREGYMTSLADGPEYRKAYWMEVARQTLEAAAPFIAAKALEDAADRFEQRSETLLKTMTNMAGHPDTSPDDVVRYGAYSAEANTTERWLRTRAAAVRGEG